MILLWEMIPTGAALRPITCGGTLRFGKNIPWLYLCLLARTRPRPRPYPLACTSLIHSRGALHYSFPLSLSKPPRGATHSGGEAVAAGHLSEESAAGSSSQGVRPLPKLHQEAAAGPPCEKVVAAEAAPLAAAARGRTSSGGYPAVCGRPRNVDGGCHAARPRRGHVG
jgi:hypothetical protein